MFVALAGFAQSATGADPEPERIICPPVLVQDMRYDSAASHARPALVVLGTATRLPDPDRQSSADYLRLEVEEVLYGDRSIKTVDFHSVSGGDPISRRHHAYGRAIFYLSEGASNKYIYRDQSPVEELAAARVLCTMRLAAFALDAQAIVAGRETTNRSFGTAASAIGMTTVEIAEVHAGTGLRQGETITVQKDPWGAFSFEPGKAPKMLYLLGPVFRERSTKLDVRGVLAKLPETLLPEVLAARTRRETYPLAGSGALEVLEKNPFTAKQIARPLPPDTREVIFEGSIDEAMSYLTSEDDAVQVLGLRYLVHHPEEARIKLLPLIEADLLRVDVTDTLAFEWQQRRIATLSMVETRAPTGAVPRLVEKILGALEEKSASIPIPVRDPKSKLSWIFREQKRLIEEDTRDTNHSLAWLIRTIERPEVDRKWGTRLLELRKRLDGWWQQEVALAIGVAGIESDREFELALARMKEVAPVRSSATLRQDGGVAATAFSPDGHFFATGGYETRIWRVSDWQLVKVIPVSANKLVFSNDSESLYVDDQRGDAEFHRYAWTSGSKVQSVGAEGPRINRLQLSRDGRVMMTADYSMDNSCLSLWDTTSGKTLRRESLPKYHADAALSVSGKMLARSVIPPGEDADSAEREVWVEPMMGGKTLLKVKGEFPASGLAFTPDDRILIVASGPPFALQESGSLALYQIGQGQNPVARQKIDGNCSGFMVVSPNGRMVAVGLGNSFGQSKVTVFSLPELKSLWTTEAPSNSVSDMCFSSDSRILAMAEGGSTPRLVRTDNFADVLTIEGHRDVVQSVFFSPDDSRLWSFGHEGTICYWDAKTMKMTGRNSIPPDCESYEILAPEGRFVVCLVRRTVDPESRNVRILDMVSDKFLPTNGSMPWDDQAVSGARILLADDQRSLLAKSSMSGSDAQMPWNLIDLETGELTHPEVTGEGNSLALGGHTYTSPKTNPAPKKLPTIRGEDNIRSVVLSPDGRRLAVATFDQESSSALIRIYDAETLRLLYAIPKTYGDYRTVFNSDATQLVVANPNGTIERWPLPANTE